MLWKWTGISGISVQNLGKILTRKVSIGDKPTISPLPRPWKWGGGGKGEILDGTLTFQKQHVYMKILFDESSADVWCAQSGQRLDVCISLTWMWTDMVNRHLYNSTAALKRWAASSGEVLERGYSTIPKRKKSRSRHLYPAYLLIPALSIPPFQISAY